MMYGASLIQLYTAMIYEGPALINNIKRELQNEIKRLGVRSITEIIGTKID
jgi:dihydroorotate dehydrogenase